jgi:predicted nucleotidyltransferase
VIAARYNVQMQTTLNSSPSEELVSAFVDCVVDAVAPLKIILYGSASRGEMSAGSDLDFLVVMPDETHKLQTMGRLYSMTSHIRFPADFVVTTPSDLQNYAGRQDLIYTHALRDGKVLYTRDENNAAA